MGNHAVLSASSSHRWMNCPPSVRLTEHMFDNGSVYAAEGSEAHALCEYKLRQALGQDATESARKPRRPPVLRQRHGGRGPQAT